VLAALLRRFGPPQPGELVALAGRPGVGKSALAHHAVAAAAVARRYDAALISLELSGRQVAERLARLTGDREALERAPLHLEDPVGLTLPGLGRLLAELRAERGVRFVALDSAPLLSRWRDDPVGHALRLRRLARSVGVVLLLVAPLPRRREVDDALAPLWTTADRVVLLETAGDAATVRVVKNRAGPTGDASLPFEPESLRFGGAQAAPLPLRCPTCGTVGLRPRDPRNAVWGRAAYLKCPYDGSGFAAF